MQLLDLTYEMENKDDALLSKSDCEFLRSAIKRVFSIVELRLLTR